MDEGVVGIERAVESIEFGAVLAGKYTILRADAAGLPDTFVCRDAGADELRAVWAIRPRHSLDPQAEAFLGELAKIRKLEHPQLQQVLDFGRDESGILFCVHAPIERRTLADVIDQDWPLSDERVVWLMCQLLATLEAAHAAGVVHGDLRPANVLVRSNDAQPRNEEILLCGLGLAAAARYAFSNAPRRPGQQLGEWIVGTPEHAAPEQLRGALHDARSDVYGAGLLLFQMLTRTVPFAGANDVDTAFMQCFTPPPPPSGYGVVTSALEAICLKALAKTPDLRYQTANELRAALLEAQASRNSQTSRQSKRLSRASQTPAPEAGSVAQLGPSSSGLQRVTGAGMQRTSSPGLQRISSPSVSAVTVIPARRHEPARASTPKRVSVPPVKQTASEPRWKKPPASLLLVCSALAVAAALILPDLKLRERESDAGMVVRGAPASEPLESSVAPVDLREAQSVSDEVSPSAAVARAPVPAPTRAPVAQVQAPKPAPTPAAAAPRAQAADRDAAVEPADVRIHAVENTVIAAEATVDANADTRRPVAIITRLDDPEDTAAPAASPTVVGEPAEQKVAAADPTSPAEAPTPPPTAAGAPQAPAAPAVAERELPRPVVLANTAPKAPAPSAPATAVRDVRVVVGEAVASHGGVSKIGLRGALNQSALARCYLDAAQGGKPVARNLKTQLELSTNMAGRVVSAKLTGQGLTQPLTRCVEDAARLGRVRGADTGEARATIDLSFVAQ